MTDSEDVLIAGRYRLITALASGGMGVVWKGWDERLERAVAIKQLRVEPGLRPDEATKARDRAMREARNTARLHHPHAVPVYDVVEHDGQPCLIMEFLRSVSLQEAIRERGTLPPAEVARIGAEVAQALSAAHSAGIVHRDVKPGNVLLGEDGTTKLTDFGISHALGDAALTATGMLTGTPAYLAPEVARGQPANFASDVFSLGATLYSASEGTPPFGEDTNAMAVLHRVASGQFRAPQRSGSLTPLLTQMLTADPDQRPSMTDVAHALAAVHAADIAAQTSGSTAAADLETARYARPPSGQQPPPPPALHPLAGTMTLPDAHSPRGPGSGAPHRRGALIAALLTGALVIAAVVVIVALVSRKSPPGSVAGGRTSGSSRTHTPAPTSQNSGSTQPATSSTGSSASAAAGAATASQLARAITDYYALLPDNVQEGWARLTPSYRQAGAGGFGAYKKFWGDFASVTASNVTGQPPGSAAATVTYVSTKGKTSTERRSFQLVRSGGQWKISASSIIG